MPAILLRHTSYDHIALQIDMDIYPENHVRTFQFIRNFNLKIGVSLLLFSLKNMKNLKVNNQSEVAFYRLRYTLSAFNEWVGAFTVSNIDAIFVAVITCMITLLGHVVFLRLQMDLLNSITPGIMIRVNQSWILTRSLCTKKYLQRLQISSGRLSLHKTKLTPSSQPLY